MNSRSWLGASILAALAASFCCILPIVFAVAGASVVGAAAAFAAWRPYLLVLTFVLLGVGFYFAYRPVKQQCEPDSACARPAMGRSGRAGLWIAAAVVALFAAFPYYSGPMAEWVLSNGGNVRVNGVVLEEAGSARIERVTLAVEGMDCPACASTIEKQLKAIPGVKRASVSYEQRRAEVEYDASAVNLGRIEAAIREHGYRVQKAS